MKIHYKYLEHERMEDAPFIGALLCANDCTFNCKNCFNQSLKNEDTLLSTAEEIIREVKSNPFNQGIILGGLEWSLQMEEMFEIIKEAFKNNLKVMIFTGLNFESYFYKVGEFVSKNKLDLYYDESYGKSYYSEIGYLYFSDLDFTELYLKTGCYDETCLVDNNIQYGVKLASKNQEIIKFTGDER